MLETGGFWNKEWVIRTFHQRKTSYYCEGSRWGNKNNPVQDNFQLAYFSVCYFVIQALQFSNIYIPCDDHISLFPYPAPHTQLKAKLIFLDESTNSVLRSLFFVPFVLLLSWATAWRCCEFFPQFFIMETAQPSPCQCPSLCRFCLEPQFIVYLRELWDR